MPTASAALRLACASLAIAARWLAVAWARSSAPPCASKAWVAYRGHPAAHRLAGALLAGQLTAVVSPRGAGKSGLLGALGALGALGGTIRDGEGRMARGPALRMAHLRQASSMDGSFPVRVREVVAMDLWSRIGSFGRIRPEDRNRIDDAGRQRRMDMPASTPATSSPAQGPMNCVHRAPGCSRPARDPAHRRAAGRSEGSGQLVRLRLCAAYAGLVLTDVKAPSDRSGSSLCLGQIPSHCHVMRGGNFKIAMPLYVTDLLAVLAAIPVAALGGATFLKGVLGVAEWLRLPKMLVATTLAAFATSSPEMAVSSMAAASGRPGIGLGDALGSNVVNLGLILGIALLFGPLAASFRECTREFALALVVPALTLLLALDGELSRADGLLLIALFVLWLTLVVRQAITHRRTAPVTADQPAAAARAGFFLLVGLAALIAAGRLFVTGASGLASALGVHPYVIGATLVAIGTSLPELVTVVLSRLRGHDDVGLGTLLGSNLFNGLAVVGTAATIQPIRAPLSELAVAATFGMVTVLLVLPRGSMISRVRGLALLAAYASFVFMTATQARQLSY